MGCKTLFGPRMEGDPEGTAAVILSRVCERRILYPILCPGPETEEIEGFKSTKAVSLPIYDSGAQMSASCPGSCYACARASGGLLHPLLQLHFMHWGVIERS